jgi:molybdate transport system substrate-binding protein
MIRLRAVARLLALAGLAALLTACGAPAPAAPLTVFAAASLRDALPAAAAAWPGGAGVAPEYNFGGSQALLAQLRQGAPADVFAAADQQTMDAAVAAGLVEAPQVFARNSLVVVFPHDNPAHIRALADLARPGLKLVLAAPSVPAGAYTLQALDRFAADPAYGPAYRRAALANVVSQEDNVRQALAKVQLGEADAAVVYGTDAQAAAGGPNGVGALAIPDRYNVLARYYIAVVKSARRPAAARAFLDYTVSAPGQAALARFGFLPATAAAVP